MVAASRGRRGHGDGAVYRSSDGRWRAAADLGWRDGRRVRKYFSGPTRAEVSAKLRRALATADSGVDIAAAGRVPTLEQWLSHWLNEIASRRVRPSTLATYRGYVQNRIIPELGKHRLDRLQPEHLERFYHRLEAEGLAAATVLQIHHIVSRALKVAMQRGKVARNVATLVDAPSVQQREVQPLTVEEARAVLASAVPLRNASRWSVALALGLRQGEALGLLWADVDLDAGILRVRNALQRQRGRGLVLVAPKSRAGRRSIPLPAELLQSLHIHRTAQTAERLRAGSTWQDRGFVFATPTGSPVDPRNDHATWKRLLETAGVRPARLHDARHTAATLLLTQGVPARVAMEILGHSQVSLTLGTYSHVSTELSRDATSRVGEALWQSTRETLAASLAASSSGAALLAPKDAGQGWAAWGSNPEPTD